MSIGGIDTGYFAAEYEAKRAKRGAAGNRFGEFAGTVQKAAGDKETETDRAADQIDYGEKSFASVGANAPEEVKQAWMEAAKESGVDGLGMSANGMLTHISQMMAQRLTNQMKGADGSNDLLGNTVQSAIRAAQQALYDLDHPRAPGNAKSIEVQRQQVKERTFYQAFLEKLGAAENFWNFAGQAARAVQEAGQATAILHGAEEGSGDTIIFSGAEPVSGSSYSVYKPADFDPKNCNTAELYAYTADLKESGKYRLGKDCEGHHAVRVSFRESERLCGVGEVSGIS